MSEGEFTFTLTERRDRNGQIYLFAGLKMFNSVLFIRKEPTIPGQPQRWQGVLKPYRPKGAEEQEAYDSPWIEKQALSEQQARDNQGESNERIANESPKPQRRSR